MINGEINLEEYNSQTEGSRIGGWYQLLDQPLVKERVFSSTPQITSIGIGLHAGSVFDPWYRQSYEPYVLAGWAHANDPNFKLALVDVNTNATESIRTGQYIYLDKIALKRDIQLQNSWLRMQRELEVPANTIYSNDGTIDLLSPFDVSTDLQYMIAQGMERIPVPAWFLNKIKSNEILIRNQDIRGDIDLRNQSLVLCLNVLLHYSGNNQALILQQISQMVGEGKLFIFNDGKPKTTSMTLTGFRMPVFKENGGWLTHSSLESDFGFRVMTITDNKRIYTLEKIRP